MRLFVDARCAAPDKREDALGPRELGQLPTGWPDLDEKLGGGMRAGSLVIVGARPSVGKTSAALGMALAAAQEKLPTVFATLEQSQIDIANRLLSAITGLPFADIELDRLTDPLDRDRLADAENQLAGLAAQDHRRKLVAPVPNPRQYTRRTPPRPATADPTCRNATSRWLRITAAGSQTEPLSDPPDIAIEIGRAHV